MAANKERRKEYQEQIADIPKDKLVYIDESGIEQAISKDRSWSPVGQPMHAKKSGKHYQRTNIVAGLVNNRSIAPMVFNGSCNTEVFNSWVENFLVKELKTGQFVVMDNTSFHKSQKTKELIEAAGCKVIFLPPYSPDLNPIERFWVNMKRWIKHRIDLFDKLYNLIKSFFSTQTST